MEHTNSLDEALAVARIRQWGAFRIILGNGKTPRPNSGAWQRRDERTFDAALVRCIDFESALNQQSDEDKVALVLRYRDRHSEEEIAKALGCSVRKVGYLIPIARKRLSETLNRLNLL